MTDFVADAALGGSGTTYTPEDFEDGGYVTLFFEALADMTAMLDYGADQTAAAAASALTAVNAPGTTATDTATSLSLADTGDVTFAIQTGKTIVAGMYMRAARTADPVTHWMSGFVKSYNSGTGALVVTMDDKSTAAGPFTGYTLHLAAPGAGAAVQTSRAIITSGLLGADTQTLGSDVTLDVPTASGADEMAGTATDKASTPASGRAGQVSQSLTDGATITPDFGAGRNFHVTLGGNRTLANPTNLAAGQSGRIRVVQDGTGSRTLAFGSKFKKPGGTITLSTAAGAVDVIPYYVHDTNNIELGILKALS